MARESFDHGRMSAVGFNRPLIQPPQQWEGTCAACRAPSMRDPVPLDTLPQQAGTNRPPAPGYLPPLGKQPGGDE